MLELLDRLGHVFVIITFKFLLIVVFNSSFYMYKFVVSIRFEIILVFFSENRFFVYFSVFENKTCDDCKRVRKSPIFLKGR